MEAHDAGLPVVLFEPMARDLFREPIAEGAMHFAAGANEIVAALTIAARHQRPPVIERSEDLARAAMEEILAWGHEKAEEARCRPMAS